MASQAELNREYVSSGRWKCDKSPTGAHHWVRLTHTTRLLEGGYFNCKYCNDVRRFITSWDDIRDMSAGQLLRWQRDNGFMSKEELSEEHGQDTSA